MLCQQKQPIHTSISTVYDQTTYEGGIAPQISLGLANSKCTEVWKPVTKVPGAALVSASKKTKACAKDYILGAPLVLLSYINGWLYNNKTD